MLPRKGRKLEDADATAQVETMKVPKEEPQNEPFPQGDEHPFPTPQPAITDAASLMAPFPALDHFPAEFPAPAPEPAIKDSEICLHVTCSALNKKNLPVTVGEIRRRMGSPEFMDFCAVGRLTRQAKSTESRLEKALVKCRFAVFEMEEQPPLNTRLISCLLEADAVTLASDYRKVMTHQLPTEVVRAIIKKAAGDSLKLHNDAIMQHLHRVKDYLVCAGRVPGDATIDPDNADQCEVYWFSLETHGLGPAAAIAVIDALTVVFTAPLPTSSSYSTKKASSDVDARLLAHLDDDDHIFDQGVIARIGYYKIPMSIGELRRRVFGPEKAHASYVCTYLRKTKTNHTLPELRRSLKNVGAELGDVDRATKKSNTVFPLLTEQECIVLARETGECLSTLPPSAKMIAGVREHPEAAACVRKITAALADAMARVGETPADMRAENEQDRYVLRFAMYTHHFGHNFYASMMRWIHDAFSQE